MQRSVWNDIVNWQTRRLNNSTKYLLHASMTTTSKKKKWNLWENCHMYALKLFWNASTWHVLEDLIVYGQRTNLQDRSRNGPKLVTNDYVDWSLTFITHVITNSIVMWETLPNNADWDCFKTPILREILRIQNLHQVEHYAFSDRSFGFAQFNRIRNQFFGSRIEVGRYPALDLWDLIVAVHGLIDDLDNVDFICSNVQSARQEALLCIFEDNEAVIKLIIKARSPTMRHVSRTHRVALDWLFGRIKLHPKIEIKYIDTKHQLADILTKRKFHTRLME